MEAAKNVIAKRYSESLFSAAVSAGVLKKVAADLSELREIFSENKQYMRFILPRIVPSKTKSMFLNTMISRLGLHAITRNFLNVLIKHNKMYAVEDIKGAFFENLEIHNNELRVIVSTAIDLDDIHREKLVTELTKVFNKEILFSLVVDPELLGGMIVRVGSRMLDTTVKNKLLRIKKLALQN